MSPLSSVLFAQFDLPTEAPPGPEEIPVQAETSPLSAVLDWVTTRISPDHVIEQAMYYGPKLLGAAAVFVVGRWIARIVTAAVVRGARKARVDPTLVGFVGNLMYMLLLTAVCISSLGQLGIETDSLTAVLAAVGFAVGMAMQGSLGNLAAGVMLIFFKPFRVGELVEVSGTKGTVVEIQIFNTILLTLDNVRIIVPNGKITEAAIHNFSAERERRIDLVIGCGYNDDLLAVKKTLMEILQAESRVLKSPEPVVAVMELGASSVNFAVRPWVLSADYGKVRFALIEEIKLAFDRNGYTIPFQCHDLFIHNAQAASTTAASPTLSLHRPAA